MNLMLATLAQVLHATLVVMAAPLLVAAVGRAEAMATGLAAPPVPWPWMAWRRAGRKQGLDTVPVSWLATAAPTVALACTATAALLVPGFTLGLALLPLADLPLLAMLLILARLVMVLAALDPGTAPAGLAAARRARIGVLGDIALMVALMACALLGGGLGLEQVATAPRDGTAGVAVAAALALAALLAVAIVDLDLGNAGLDTQADGHDRAALGFAEGLRMVLWCDLIAVLCFPAGMAGVEAGAAGWLIGLVAWIGRLGLFALLVAGVRVIAGRLGEGWARPVLSTALLLGLLAIILALTPAGRVLDHVSAPPTWSRA